MKARAANDTIITRAKQRGSAATTRVGAWRYLLAHLPQPQCGTVGRPGGAHGSREEQTYLTLRRERTGDGRARALGYDPDDPNTPGRNLTRAWQRNWECDQYQREYVRHAISVPEALGKQVQATWNAGPLYIALPGRYTALVTWDIDSDWDAYAKSYGRPKNTYSNRRVEVWRWTPEVGIEQVLTIPVKAYRGYWLRRTLIEIAQRLVIPSLCEIIRTTPTEREREKIEPATPKPCYTRVAVRADGAWVSIYDGNTVYALGVTVQDTPRKCPDYDDICGYGGIFLHHSQARAEAQQYPDSAAALALPRATIRGEYWGRTNVNGKISAEYFRPVEVVTAEEPCP